MHTLHMLSIRTFTVMALTCLATVAHAQTWQPQQEVVSSFQRDFDHVHDKGPALRIGAGVSIGDTEYIDGGVSPDGFVAAQWDIALGYVLSEGVMLSVEQWGRTRASSGLLSAGLGLTLYPDPSDNLWGGLSLGVCSPWDSDDTNDVELFGQLGLSAQLQVGTGWWVADAWSAGFAVALGGSHVDLDGDGTLTAGWHLGLMITLAGD